MTQCLHCTCSACGDHCHSCSRAGQCDYDQCYERFGLYRNNRTCGGKTWQTSIQKLVFETNIAMHMPSIGYKFDSSCTLVLYHTLPSRSVLPVNGTTVQWRS